MNRFRSFITTICLGVCLLTLGCSDQQTPADQTIDDQVIPLDRLSHQVVPTHYELFLDVDPDAQGFSGETTITVRVNDPTSTLWLHGKDLQVSSVTAATERSDRITGSYEQVAEIGVARLRFEKSLPRGLAAISIRYRADYNSNVEGLFKVNSGGRNYIFSDFKTISARRVFPAFDEPGFKVPFDIWMEVDPALVAVASTPAVEFSNLDNGNKLIRFQTTKPISPYLLSFAVGPLDQREGEPIPTTGLRDYPIPFQAYAMAGRSEELQFAMDNTLSLVTTQENYFGHAYPYEKLALIAVPELSSVAMQNVGAISYRERVLLQSDRTPQAIRQTFMAVHAHELAHQWFGNLVTPEWWDDVWLNEAFATWMAARSLHQLDPDAGYQMRMLDSVLATMKVDQLMTARQMRPPVSASQEIGGVFDSISLSKGSAMLSMFERYLGEDEFRAGVRQFIQQHRYQNANAGDFVQAIAATRPDLPEGQVGQVFYSFLEQPGVPFVSVDWLCNEEGETTVTAAQSRYLPVGSEGDRQQTWQLPLCVSFEDAGVVRQQCELIDQPRIEFQLDSDVCPAFLMPNAGADGYYRWSLPVEQWHSLLQSGLLSDREVLATVDSISAAFHAGTISVQDYLALLPDILRHDSPRVVTAPLQDLKLIEEEMLLPRQIPQYRQLLAQLYEPVFTRVSPDKSLTDTGQIRLRTDMYKLFALWLRESSLRQSLRDQALGYLSPGDDKNSGGKNLQPGSIDNNIRGIALMVAVEMEGEELADLMLARFQASDDAVLREEILSALAHSDDAQLLDQLRNLALSGEAREIETDRILNALMASPETRIDTWRWLQANIDALIERQPAWTQGRVINYAAPLCDAGYAEQIDTQLGEKIAALGQGALRLANTLESIQLCEALVQHHSPGAQGFFE